MLGQLVRYDASVFDPTSESYAARGLCTFSRTCGGQEAEFMVQQSAANGIVWIGLCRQHALDRVKDARKLPD